MERCCGKSRYDVITTLTLAAPSPLPGCPTSPSAVRRRRPTHHATAPCVHRATRAGMNPAPPPLCRAACVQVIGRSSAVCCFVDRRATRVLDGNERTAWVSMSNSLEWIAFDLGGEIPDSSGMPAAL